MSRTVRNETTRPVIILGAARSGTKMLRDTIAAHPCMIAIPYDVNFVWKYGNYHINHDELTSADLTPHTAAFIRRFVARFSTGRPDVRVVEKSVSNTVRVEFVRRVFPTCHFIHLIRDGRDVAASSMRQWQAPLDSWRVLDKLKHFPIQALPHYGVNYARSYLKRALSRTGHVPTWGVMLKDLHELVQCYSLLEVCGLQWSRCVEHTLKALQDIPEMHKIEVRYERLVQNPLVEIERIMKFIGLDMTDDMMRNTAENIKPYSIGKWQRQLQPEELDRLMRHIVKTMQWLGYLDRQAVMARPSQTTEQVQ